MPIADPQKSQRYLREEKRAQRLTFWVRRLPGRVGVLPREGVVAEKFVPPSNFFLSWVLNRVFWNVQGILPGCPGPWGFFKKFVQKKIVRIFRSLPLAYRNRCDFSICNCDAHRGPRKSQRFPRQAKGGDRPDASTWLPWKRPCFSAHLFWASAAAVYALLFGTSADLI